MTIWTHSVGGLTDNDFILAAKIEGKTEGKTDDKTAGRPDRSPA